MLCRPSRTIKTTRRFMCNHRFGRGERRRPQGRAICRRSFLVPCSTVSRGRRRDKHVLVFKAPQGFCGDQALTLHTRSGARYSCIPSAVASALLGRVLNAADLLIFEARSRHRLGGAAKSRWRVFGFSGRGSGVSRGHEFGPRRAYTDSSTGRAAGDGSQRALHDGSEQKRVRYIILRSLRTSHQHKYSCV